MIHTLALALSLAAAPRQFVVVPRGADLHFAPSQHAPHVRERSERYRVFARVGEPREGWLEVESVPGEVDDPFTSGDDGFHCYPAEPGLEGLRLRFWIRANAVTQVITQQVEARFKDGSSVTLLPGVVVASADGTPTLEVDGLSLHVGVSPEAIGQTYVPARYGYQPAQPPRYLPAGERVILDGHEVNLDRTPDLLQLSRTTHEAGKKFEEIRWGCAAFRFLARGAAEGAGTRAPGGLLGMLSGSGPRQMAVEGAKAYWPDGSEAGEVAFDTATPAAELPRSHGRRCFAFGLGELGAKDKGDVPVCFAPASITTKAPFQSLGGLEGGTLFDAPDAGGR